MLLFLPFAFLTLFYHTLWRKAIRLEDFFDRLIEVLYGFKKDSIIKSLDKICIYIERLREGRDLTLDSIGY